MLIYWNSAEARFRFSAQLDFENASYDGSYGRDFREEMFNEYEGFTPPLDSRLFIRRFNHFIEKDISKTNRQSPYKDFEEVIMVEDYDVGFFCLKRGDRCLVMSSDMNDEFSTKLFKNGYNVYVENDKFKSLDK